MIFPNNPAIDVDELMKRVRADAARLRASGAIEFRRGSSPNPYDEHFALALDRQHSVNAHLGEAERLNSGRTEVPKRLAALAVLRPLTRLALRIFNYLFKQQREWNAHVLLASREASTIQTAIGEQLARLSDDLKSMERYRLEGFRELRTSIASIDDKLRGLEHSHHHTRELANVAHAEAAMFGEARHTIKVAHERIDTAESDIHRIAAQIKDVESAVPRTEFAHQRIDSSESDIHNIADQLKAIPNRTEVFVQITREVQDVNRRLAEFTESALRADAISRMEILRLSGALDFSKAEPVAHVPADAVPAAVNDALHAAIGDKFRGSRSDIEARFAQYLPELARDRITTEHPLLDIGSGRGEWLDVLRKHDIAAVGLELNGVLAQESRVLGHDVAKQDALTALRERPDHSLGAVTAFHVVEHLSFDYLAALIAQIQRVLVPGGTLIFETPNPRNLIVSTRTFYLDPTHRNPVPSELLAFLVASAGFADVREREFSPVESSPFTGDDATSRALHDYFAGPQDYAILATSPL